MPSYILLLLAASLVVVAVYFFLGKSIPIEPPVYYTSVGFSLLLSVALPYFLASLNVFGVVIIYILLILFFSLGLTVVREKLLLKRIPADPENTYVGKKVGLLTGTTRSDEPTFGEIMAQQLASIIPENAGREDPFLPQDTPEDPEAPEAETPAPEAPGDRLEEESPAPCLPLEVTPPVLDEDPQAATGPDVREQPGAAYQPEDLDGDVVPEYQVTPETGEAAVPETDAPAGPRTKDRGQYAVALHGLFKALGMAPPLRVKARLTLRLSEVYRDLGQYWQAVEVIRTFLTAAGDSPDGEILNALIVTAAYCQAIQRILREEGLNPVPHADLTEGIRARSIKLAGKLILQGGWQGEEIAGNH
ncbi:MAG TPA: hypothetical protein VMW83_03830 [Spirochaetia bacterium]|nr:hypothetical protein [Spirochaetia bacterium]